MRTKIAIFLALLVVITIISYSGTASAHPFAPQSKIPSFIEQKIFKSRTVLVYPIFTQAAYGMGGFYSYYSKNCDIKCLTVPLPSKPFLAYVASGQGYLYLSSLGFNVVTDVDVDKNPNILNGYKNVIVLHNEYVTEAEFRAITSHQNVIYLYPNSLYAKVEVNYNTGQIHLVRGHSYPTPSVLNGFEWNLDNSRYEYNTSCASWNFYRVVNGWMLNCYPDIVISSNGVLQDSLVERISD